MRGCPYGLCDGTGFLVEETTNTARDCRCRPARLSRARSRSLAHVIPRRYRGVSFERAPVTDIQPAATVDVVRSYVDDLAENLTAGRGLWFFGGVGTGKTTLAMLVSSSALATAQSVAIYSLPRLLAEVRTTFDEGARSSHLELLDRLTSVDLLHIDDVGAERTSPWVLEQLYSIVNARYEDRRSVIITTNLERAQLAEQITERTVSRLEEMCEILPLRGGDARQYRPAIGPSAETAPAPSPA